MMNRSGSGNKLHPTIIRGGGGWIYVCVLFDTQVLFVDGELWKSS